MRNVLAIARRELGATFGQPAAYVFVAAFLALSALLGLRGFFERDVADLRDYFGGLRYAFALFGPAAAMRLWAEERRLGTLELLFTLPVRPWEAVLGKFLAGLALVAASLAAGTVLPLSLAPFGPFDAGQIAAGYLGALLLGGTFLAVGLLTSALTESQVVAFVLGVLGCAVLVVLGDAALMNVAERVLPGAVLDVLAELGVGPHYDVVTRGVIDTRDLGYFAGLIAFLLFGNVLAVERRERDRGEPWVAGGLALLALLLWLDLQGHAQARLDVTLQRRNSLAPETLRTLDRVAERLTIRAYVSSNLPESTRPHVRRLLDLLEDVRAAREERVVLEVIDPEAPHLTQVGKKRLREQAEREGVARVELQIPQEDRFETVLVYGGVSFAYGDRPVAAIPFAVQSQNLEYDLAVAIQRLVLPRLRIGLGGEGVASYGQARQALRQAHATQDLDLTQTAAVPPEVDCLVYALPTPPSERVVYAIDQYVAGGGRALLLTEGFLADQRLWQAGRWPDGHLHRALEAWGLGLGGLVYAPTRRTWDFADDGARIRSYYGWYVDGAAGSTSPAAGDLGRLLFPYATEVTTAPPAGVEAAVLVRSAPGWAFEGRPDIHPARLPRPEEEPAPRVLAAAVTGPLPSSWAGGAAPAPPEGTREDPLATPRAAPAGPGRVALVGDADFLRDGNQAAGAGVPLLLNLVDWLVDRSLAGIRSREAVYPLDDRTEVLGLPREGVLTGLNVVVVPLLVVVGGLLALGLARGRWARRAASARDRKAAAVEGQP